MMLRFWIIWILMSLAAPIANGAPLEQKASVADIIEVVAVTVKTWWNKWTGAEAPKQQQTAVAKRAPVQQTRKPAMQLQPVQQPTAAAAAPAAVTASAPAPVTAPATVAAPVAAVKGNATLKDVQALRDRAKAAPLFKVKTAARAGTSKLARTPAQVPVTDWARFKMTKSIPRLDIGTETLISREDFQLETLNWGARGVPDLKPEATPKGASDSEIAKLTGQKVTKAGAARQLEARIRPVGQPLSQEMVDKVQYAIVEVPDYTPLAYRPLSDEEMKMMAALILFDKGGHCHMVMGLFHQLAEAPKTHSEATYHLGACASQMKMNQAAYQHLSTLVASEDKEYGAAALEILSMNLPYQYEMEFYRLLRRVQNMPKLITEKAHDTVYYRMAKGAYKNGALKTALGYSEQVSDKSEFIDDNRFLAAMVSFATGDKVGALSKLQALWDSLEARKVQDKNIRALTAVNLARMHFAQKQYDKALENYMRVPKDHALWVQALIEQGWTQLALEDFSGAIGNMYSLHSPYFKAVYQPESFVVRTIGYLNICQYGDAYKSLSWLEKDYRGWSDHLATYAKNKSTAADVYNTVKTYIKGKSTDDVDGVPFQVWRELARRKDFLNQQTALNEKQDEGQRYEGGNEKIKKEKADIRADAESAKKRFDSYKVQLNKAKAAGKAAKEVEKLMAGLQLERERTMGYRYHLHILELSRAGYLDFQKTAQANVDGETVKLTAKAGDLLLKRAKEMQTEMARVLDNNEFLRYEVFAGSGENIRYQVAGGKIDGTNRIPASIKPTKMMNWSFDGEFWEDEIGSYRSSLSNSCAASETQQAQHKEEDEGE